MAAPPVLSLSSGPRGWCAVMTTQGKCQHLGVAVAGSAPRPPLQAGRPPAWGPGHSPAPGRAPGEDSQWPVRSRPGWKTRGGTLVQFMA